ncbi:LuxR C-terminal-related transcriptional regulator [Bradyrhizobium sp. UFLA05-153]
MTSQAIEGACAFAWRNYLLLHSGVSENDNRRSALRRYVTNLRDTGQSDFDLLQIAAVAYLKNLDELHDDRAARLAADRALAECLGHAVHNPTLGCRTWPYEMVQRARDWGLQDGYVVPVASPAGRLGQVWFGGHEDELPEHDLPALHFMALYAFDQVLRLRGTPDAPHIILSEREREVLTLAALGRTSDQIAEAMNITERTVKEHIKNCCKKLGAVTRTQAVMIAMRDRIIQP